MGVNKGQTSERPALTHLGKKGEMTPVETYLYNMTTMSKIESALDRVKEAAPEDLTDSEIWGSLVLDQRLVMVSTVVITPLWLYQMTTGGFSFGEAVDIQIMTMLIMLASCLLFVPRHIESKINKYVTCLLTTSVADGILLLLLLVVSNILFGVF